MSVPVRESVFYACQEAIQAVRAAARVPSWLMLGEDEWARIHDEIKPLFANQQALSALTELQGVHVARYAAPSHLEVLPA